MKGQGLRILYISSIENPINPRGFHVRYQEAIQLLHFLSTGVISFIVEQNYGVLPKRFRKLLIWFELVCVEEYLPRSDFVRWDVCLYTGFTLHGHSWPRWR